MRDHIISEGVALGDPRAGSRGTKLGIAVLALALLGAPALVQGGAYEPDRPGVTIFKANCASCHGYDGQGKTMGYTSFVDETPSVDIAGAQVVDTVRQGKPPFMPGFNHAEISEGEANNLEQYVMGLPNNTMMDPASQYTVTLLDEDPWFSPYTLAVPNQALPATIKFINAGQTWHTLTSADFLVDPLVSRPQQPTYGPQGNAIQPPGAQINSGLFGRGGRYFLTLTQAGTYKYYCMLHPFMQIKVCAGSTTCSPDSLTPPSPNPTKGLPTAPGFGELWVAVQGINVPGKSVDTGAAVPPFPDLSSGFDDFVKDGEMQVINLVNYSVVRTPTPQQNTMNNPHYIWARQGTTEMVVTNYLDNYLTMFNAETRSVSVPMFTWGTTASHITGLFDGSMLWGPVQGDYGVQELKPGGSIGDWALGHLERIVTVDQRSLTGSMPHGIWAGGPNGTKWITANSRTNNATIHNTLSGAQRTCGMGDFPLNPGLTTNASTLATTNVTNPTTAPSSLSIRVGATNANLCGGAEARLRLEGSGPVQTPPSPDDRFFAVSNGPFISVIDLRSHFPTGSTCAGSMATYDPPNVPLPAAGGFTVRAGFKLCNLNESAYGAHGVAWSRRGDGGSGWRIYMPGKFVDFVAVTDVTYLGSPISGPVAISHVGDIPLLKYTTGTCTRRSLAGCTDTVPQGVTTRPLPAPWS